MLRKHLTTIVAMNRYPLLKSMIREYFDLPEGIALTPALYQRGLGQADLVLALLRVEHFMAREFIRMLIGKRIVIGTPCLLRYYRNGPPTPVRAREGIDRRIIYVTPVNPRQPKTEAALRWQDFREGRTIGQVMSRGATKRDVRRALRKGWIRVEEVENHA